MEDELKGSLMYETLERVPQLARAKRRTIMSKTLQDHLSQIKTQTVPDKKEEALVTFSTLLDSDEMYQTLAVEHGAIATVMTSLSSAQQDIKVFLAAAAVFDVLLKNTREAKEAANSTNLSATLVKCLSTPGTDRTIQIKAMQLLQTLSSGNTAAQLSAGDAGAVEILVSMVTDSKDDKEVLGCAMDALLGLVKDNRATQTRAVDAGAIRALLNVLQNREHKKALFGACSVLEACMKDNLAVQTKAMELGALSRITDLVKQAGGDAGIRGMGIWLFQTLSAHKEVSSDHLPLLMALIQMESEKTVLRDVVLSVHNIMQNHNTAEKTFDGGKLIQVMVDCLVKPANSGLAKELGKAICGILKDSESAQTEAVDAGVMPVLISQLQTSTNSEILNIACQIMFIICGGEDGKLTALQHGLLKQIRGLLQARDRQSDARPLAKLVIVLSSGGEDVAEEHHSDLLAVLVRLLKLLYKPPPDPPAVALARQLTWVLYSVIDDNDEATDVIIKEGGLEPLLSWLKVKEVAVVAANAVRVLMTEREAVISQALDLHLIPTVAGALSESGLSAQAAGVLLWLLDDPTKDNERGKQQVVDVGIVHRLYNFLGTFSQDTEVVQVVAWVVYHVTSDFKPGQQAVLQAGILPKLLEQLQTADTESQHLFPALWSLFNVMSAVPEALDTALASGAAGSMLQLLATGRLEPMLAFAVLRILEILSTTEDGRTRLKVVKAESTITDCLSKGSLNDVSTATAKDILKNLGSVEPPDRDG